MTDDQKANRVRVCQKLLNRSDEDDTSSQELRVRKISLQFVILSVCPFYNLTNEKKQSLLKNRVAYQQMKTSAVVKRRFNQLICTNSATPSGFS